MPINRDEIISVVSQLAEHENLQVTVKESMKGACIVGSSAFAGGLLGGPVGLCIGGIAGSLAGLAYGKGKYRAVADVITFDMTPAQQRKLADSINRVIRDIRIEDFTLLLPLFLNDAGIKALVMNELINFMQRELSYSIAA